MIFSTKLAEKGLIHTTFFVKKPMFPGGGGITSQNHQIEMRIKRSSKNQTLGPNQPK